MTRSGRSNNRRRLEVNPRSPTCESNSLNPPETQDNALPTCHVSAMRFVIPGRDGDGVWIAGCPAIPGCISQGATRERGDGKRPRGHSGLSGSPRRTGNAPDRRNPACGSRRRLKSPWPVSRFPITRNSPKPPCAACSALPGWLPNGSSNFADKKAAVPNQSIIPNLTKNMTLGGRISPLITLIYWF